MAMQNGDQFWAEEAQLQRDLGRLQAQVEILTTRLDQLDSKIDKLLTFMDENKGSMKTLSIVAAVMGTLGAVMAWLVEHALKLLNK